MTASPENSAPAGPAALPGLGKDRLALLVIFLIALGLRLLYLHQISGQVFFQNFGNRAIVQWTAVPHYSSGGPYTFQAILEASSGAGTSR